MLSFFKNRSRLWLVLPLATALAGCRNEASENLAREALQGDAKDEKPGLASVKSAVFKDWEIAGRDKQRRPLWRLKARESRIGSGNSASPTRATLLGAHAELYADGKLESAFDAERIEFSSSAAGVRLVLSGGVRAQAAPPRASLGKVGALQFAAQKPAEQKAGAPIVLVAPRVEVSVREKRVWVPAGAVVTQASNGLRVASGTLRADSGLARIDMTGGVDAQSPRGRVRADSATYGWQSQRLLARGKVSALAPIRANGEKLNLTIEGDRLDADAAGERGVMSGRVRAKAKNGQASAGRVAFNWRSRTLEASNGVRLEQGGATLQAGSIETDHEFSRAIARNGVRLIKGGASLRASFVEANDGFTRATASGGVELQQSTSRGRATLRAARLQGWADFSRAVASGDVRVAVAGNSGTASLRAGRVEAFDDFSCAVAAGGVTLQQGGATVRAGSVQAFDLRGAGRAVARGGVSLQQGNATLRADAVEAFDLRGGGRAVARGGVALSRGDLQVRAQNVDATGLRDEKALVVAASGNVQARNAKGSVSSQRVRWANGRVQASGGVSLSRGALSLHGDEASSDDSFDKAVLTGDVRAQGFARQFAGTTVRAARVEKNSERISAIGGVSAQGRGAQMRAARLDATANGSDALLSGGVVLSTRDGATLRAPLVRYSEGRDQAYASGGIRYTDRARGLNLNGRSVVVRRLSDSKRREAVVDGVSGGGTSRALEGLKIF
jgi:lipopolysaccharide assembly outer membrane protein LptD (OstA)